MNNINVYSECAKLDEVLLNCPSEELNNIYPDILEETLFDELPFLEIAKKEHDMFARKLLENGIRVIYYDDLLLEIFKNHDVRENFTKDFSNQVLIDQNEKEILYRYLSNSSDEKSFLKSVRSGIRKKEIKDYSGFDCKRELFTLPLANLYFQRDPFSFVGNNVVISNFKYKMRQTESLFANYLFKYHPRFKDVDILYDNTYPGNIEGGDIIVLNESCVAIGISQRTDFEAIKCLSLNLLTKTDFKKVLAIKIPNKRTSMHLDTVFTAVNYDTFLAHQMAYLTDEIYEITYNEKLLINRINSNLFNCLQDNLKREIKFIKCGGESMIDSWRDQWNDGANCLAIAPNKIIVYDRNVVTNELLKQKNIEIIPIPSSELSRGRGGPRCMSMPIRRIND